MIDRITFRTNPALTLAIDQRLQREGRVSREEWLREVVSSAVARELAEIEIHKGLLDLRRNYGTDPDRS